MYAFRHTSTKNLPGKPTTKILKEMLNLVSES